MNNNEVERIDLGKVVLIKDDCGRWDFYRNKHGNNPQRIRRDRFETVEVVGDVVYGRKKNKSGEELLGIYDLRGNVKLYPKRVIDCGETFVVQKPLTWVWDFYTKKGKRLTYCFFEGVEVYEKKLIRVSYWFSGKAGMYNSKAEVVIPMGYYDELYVCSDKERKPLCIVIEEGNSQKFYELDGAEMEDSRKKKLGL